MSMFLRLMMHKLLFLATMRCLLLRIKIIMTFLFLATLDHLILRAHVAPDAHIHPDKGAMLRSRLHLSYGAKCVVCRRERDARVFHLHVHYVLSFKQVCGVPTSCGGMISVSSMDTLQADRSCVRRLQTGAVDKRHLHGDMERGGPSRPLDLNNCVMSMC